MEIRPLLGLLGVVIAAFTVGFNDSVTSAALVDVRGGLGISADQGTWLTSLYATGQIIGTGVGPWTAATVTVRRFALFALGFGCAVTLPIPFCANLTLLYSLRLMQGLATGFTIPLLLLVALRVLQPSIRLYGLSLYALTATFAPNLSEALAGLWTDLVDWRFVFFQDLPLYTLAGVLIWYGVGPDQPRYERFKTFDWRGFLLIIIIASATVPLLEQGDRYDWFNSKTICLLALVSAVAVPSLIANEFIATTPLLGLKLLARRNLAYGLVALFTLLLLIETSSTIPADILTRIAGFRPEQIYGITVLIALPQFILLPALAMLLNQVWADPRVVSFIGLVLIVVACVGNSFLTSDWDASQFVLWQAFQAVGQPMVILPLLMMSTNTLTKPTDGPPGSAMVNLMRGLSEPTAIWLSQLIQRWRGGLHYNRLVDQAGQGRFAVLQAQPLIPGVVPPLSPDGQPRGMGSLAAFQQAVQDQSMVLTFSDTFLVFAAIGIALMVVLCVLPVRTYPPRIVLAKK